MKENKKIYLDASAGIKTHPQVVDTMVDVLKNHWGNASSDNSMGVDARQIINNVTTYIASDINCNPEELIFTSGACEANSLAIKGYLNKNNFNVDFISSTIEHTSINEIKNEIKYKNKCYVGDAIVNYEGKIKLDYLELELMDLKPRSIVAISFANSETGTIQDIKSISKLVHKYNCILLVDATQYFPWYKIDVNYYGIDMMSVSGQKLGAPRGIGFLYVKNGIEIEPLISGSQQKGIRAGTQPTSLIAAFSKALEITRRKCIYNIELYRNYIISSLQKINGIKVNGPIFDVLPNIISVTVDDVEADRLVALCDVLGVIIAKGSACKSYSPEPSQTLLNIGLSEEQALSTIRISLSHYLSHEDVIKATDIIVSVIKRIRKSNS